MSPKKLPSTDCSPTWRPDRRFWGATGTLAVLAAGFLLAASQMPRERRTQELTPPQVVRITNLIPLPPGDPEDAPHLLRKLPAGEKDPRPPRRVDPPASRRSARNIVAIRGARDMAMKSGVLGILTTTRMSPFMSPHVDGAGSFWNTAGGHGYATASPPSGASGTSTELGLLGSSLQDTSRYQQLPDNAIQAVAQAPVSTFSMDVDTGSYSNVRGYIARGILPPPDAVRVEEMINYFPYEYAAPPARGEHPFGIETELARCPWNPEHLLLRVGIQAKRESRRAMPPANLVFLVDVSGSMQTSDKLPLLQSSLRMLVKVLRPEDSVGIVTYAGQESIALARTPGSEKQKILRAIDSLSAGGSTAGEAGIRAAYALAKEGFVRGGINRVLLATDGDFNVGVTDTRQLKSLIAEERRSGVSLSTLGFGLFNFNDELMEQLADVGNGSYSYIDSLAEGRKVLEEQVLSTLHTVAKDAKIQVEFQPAHVSEYRLIGYENRLLRREDFKNDAVDAGEVGAGASVTALYELTPSGGARAVEPLRYQTEAGAAAMNKNGDRLLDEVAFVRVRYQPPNGGASRELKHAVRYAHAVPTFERSSDDFRFAAAVAGFGQLLRGGRHTQQLGMRQVLAIAKASRGQDPEGYRRDFVALVQKAAALKARYE